MIKNQNEAEYWTDDRLNGKRSSAIVLMEKWWQTGEMMAVDSAATFENSAKMCQQCPVLNCFILSLRENLFYVVNEKYSKWIHLEFKQEMCILPEIGLNVKPMTSSVHLFSWGSKLDHQANKFQSALKLGTRKKRASWMYTIPTAMVKFKYDAFGIFCAESVQAFRLRWIIKYFLLVFVGCDAERLSESP